MKREKKIELQLELELEHIETYQSLHKKNPDSLIG